MRNKEVMHRAKWKTGNKQKYSRGSGRRRKERRKGARHMGTGEGVRGRGQSQNLHQTSSRKRRI